MNRNNLRTFAISALLCLASSVHGLPDDRRQAINLSSDKATYENNRGIYTGNVNMSQGSLIIRADKLIIVEADRKVTKVIAHGSPAHFEQQPRAGEGVVVASARLIEYSLNAEEILLQKDATIRHQGSKISGDRIVYSGASKWSLPMAAPQTRWQGTNDPTASAGRGDTDSPAPSTTPTPRRLPANMPVLKASNLAKAYKGRGNQTSP